MDSYILVTGGCGFLGSHVVVELLEAGYDVLVVDNLSNSSCQAMNRVYKITGKRVIFEEGDVRDAEFINSIFERHNIDLVIHLAGLKSIGDSFVNPLEYYDNNFQGTLSLIRIMAFYNVKRLIFSSSATVYGAASELPFKESGILVEPSNPYGYTKYCIERVLDDLAVSDKEWSIIKFRYFNPVGAHRSGLIGEYSRGSATNLMPHVLSAADGRTVLEIFGNDFPTKDGTAIRDFIHVSDLAKGHCSGIEFCINNVGSHAFNLGTGTGYSVMQMVNTFREVTGVDIEYRISGRRLGDAPVSYADVSLAESALDWSANLGLTEMCIDSWNWYCSEKLTANTVK